MGTKQRRDDRAMMGTLPVKVPNGVLRVAARDIRDAMKMIEDVLWTMREQEDFDRHRAQVAALAMEEPKRRLEKAASSLEEHQAGF